MLNNSNAAAVRERLPNRRASETFAVEVGGRRYRATISRYADGRIGEIFLSNNKAGSDSDTAARELGGRLLNRIAIRRPTRRHPPRPNAR